MDRADEAEAGRDEGQRQAGLRGGRDEGRMCAGMRPGPAREEAARAEGVGPMEWRRAGPMGRGRPG